MSTVDHAQQVLELADQRGLVRARDLEGTGIARTTLSRLVERGELARVSRGIYRRTHRTPSEKDQLAEVALRARRGVFCLLTALRIHELTTQSPHEVWLALPNKGHPPILDYPPLRIFRFSGPALTEGVQHVGVGGLTIPVYSVAKTVADCFKFRNKIGLDVGLEALRECKRERRATNDELWHYARVCRVTEVMRPYMESTE